MESNYQSRCVFLTFVVVTDFPHLLNLLRPHFHETKRNNIAAYKNVFLLFHLTVVRDRVVMVWTDWSRDPESYAGSSIASERISHADTGLRWWPCLKEIPWSSRLGFGRGATTPPLENTTVTQPQHWGQISPRDVVPVKEEEGDMFRVCGRSF